VGPRTGNVGVRYEIDLSRGNMSLFLRGKELYKFEFKVKPVSEIRFSNAEFQIYFNVNFKITGLYSERTLLSSECIFAHGKLLKLLATLFRCTGGQFE
jgi:hypothetical protein